MNVESDNYLTGDRKTTKSRGNKKDVVANTKFAIEKMYLGEVDIQKLDEAAFARIDN